MPDFILEIGFEEMPARFLPDLTQDFKKILDNGLHSWMLDFEQTQTCSTPRRLCAYVSALASTQNQKQELVYGPPVSIGLDQDNNPTKAGLGFARSQQVDFKDVEVQDTEKGAYLAVTKTLGGKKSSHILPDLCIHSLKSLSFPKKMRWADNFAFGRPIRWILALLEDQVIDFQISDVRAGNLTYGHRVLGAGPFRIDRAEHYFHVLHEKGRVVLDFTQRLEITNHRSRDLAKQAGGEIIYNEDLTRENANLAETPKPILGRFDNTYLGLPREVLLTSMESHQKSFGIEDSKGQIMPYFVAVIDHDPEDPEPIRKGWERVLKARLEDAKFFWETDKAASFDEWLQKLENVVFLAPLGSMGEKSRRIERVSGFLCDQLGVSNKKDVQKAALISKADLVSEIVGEFSDLQGIMGGIYASHAGYNDNIARAVYEHYLPLGPESELPSSMEAAIVSMADKLDNLVGCFGLNLLPSGAADPYALRRQSLGIVRIILGYGLRLDLQKILSFTAQNYEGAQWKKDPEQALENLIKFFSDRLKAYWQAQGFDSKLVDAIIQSGFRDLLSAEHRLLAIKDFSQDQAFEAAVLTYKRVDNIVRKQSFGIDLDEAYDTHLLQEENEIGLDRAIKEYMSDWDTLWEQERFQELFAKLHILRPYVDAFFDHVMVMCEDERLRENRLRMLHSLSQRFRKLADFSALQV